MRTTRPLRRKAGQQARISEFCFPISVIQSPIHPVAHFSACPFAAESRLAGAAAGAHLSVHFG